jgi:multicomponent Na+:H+ antiporter subunit B
MVFSIYSLLSAVLFVTLDAVDVAFTEAAVGAGISVILMLMTLAITSARQKPLPKIAPAPLLVALATGLVLAWGMAGLPDFADPRAPAHRHVVPRYLTQSGEEIGIPNVVTSVLASYRGYDTLGEVTVIFTAGIGVLCLIGRTRRRADDDGETKRRD